METHDSLARFIDFDASDVERIHQLEETLRARLQELVAETCTELAIDVSSDETQPLQRALTGWLERLFDAPFTLERRREDDAFDEMLHASSPWTECLLATLHRLRRHLGQHIHEASDFETDAERERYRASLEKAFDFEVLRLVRARHRSDLHGRAEHLTSLAAGLSHEIYNPLHSISLHLSLLERQLQAGDAPDDRRAPKYATMLQAVREELQRIGNFTSELSDFSRPLPIRVAPIEADAFLSAFVDAHAPALASAGVDLFWSSTAPPGHMMHVDPDFLEEALMNLVQNAVEAMETSGSIELRVSRAAGATRLDVVDSGPGFAASAHRRAFDLFFTTKATGTGLGLPIVRKIVGAHDGAVDILNRSEDGGATIRITLHPAESERTHDAVPDRSLQELQRFSQH